MWTWSGRTRGSPLFLRTLASFARLIVFDRRGTGASDPLPPGSPPPWESYAQDLTAVLDEVGSEQAALLAQLDVSPMALFFAGTRPERTRALILANAAAKFLASDDYPSPGGVAPASSSYVGTTSVAWPCTSRPG
jgi:pimeloyl-ACP methyl ester carboxylesterase